MRMFIDFQNNDELLEKLAVIIQKITYHNNVKGLYFISLFKETLLYIILIRQGKPDIHRDFHRKAKKYRKKPKF